MWISTNFSNIYLASIRFKTLQYFCNTLYKSQHIPMVLGILPNQYLYSGTIYIYLNAVHSPKENIPDTEELGSDSLLHNHHSSPLLGIFCCSISQNSSQSCEFAYITVN
jgi:hypothetical protein